MWVADSINNRVQEFTPSGLFLTTFGDKGASNAQFEESWGIAFGASGAVYVADVKNNRVQKWTSIPLPGNEGAHDIRTAYYSAGEESEVAACRKHPEWANLPCQTEPAAQPGISASPELPVTTMVYNMWDEVEVTEEKFGTTVRKKTQTYDPAGRALTSEEASTIDTALPRVTNEYNTATGALENQSATISGKTKTITSKDNTLGQLVEYTDAEGNVAKYVYEEGSDGRLEEVSEGKGKEAESKRTFSYNATTGLMEKLIDTAADMSSAEGTFMASYDVEGKMTSETYPNGMCANTTYNATGAATSIEYLAPKTCTSKEPTVWFSDRIVPSIHGETLEQVSTLSKEKYRYDEVGRLTEAQETPADKGCTSRLYGYDEESDRTSEVQRESATETCATEGGIVQGHAYDSANRLIDSGVEYEVFDNTTKMPAIDAGEHEMTDTYYVDNQVASQTQSEETIKYTYDPSGRAMETVSEGKTSVKVISHYAGSGNALTWTSEGSEKWTRNIPGIDGALDAIQEAGKSPVLQLHDLEGNIVGTVEDSESATKLLSTYNSTEFGVPQSGTTPPKYAWLGATGVSSEPSLGSGTSTEGGASYVPQVARSLQTAPVVPPGAFPNGQGTGSQYDSVIPGWYTSLSNAQSAATAAAYQKKLEEEARKRAEEAKKLEEELNPSPAEGGAEEEEWEGTIGDPTGCNVRAFEPQQEETVTHHPLEGWGSFVCDHALDSVTMEVCLQEERTAGHWYIITSSYDATTFANFDFGEFGSKKINCSVGKQYRTAVWLHVGKENGEKKRSGSTECEENLGEVGLGVL